MLATVLSEPTSPLPAAAGEPTSAQVAGAAAAVDVESATCDCCGLTEECTPAYVARVRGLYVGLWLCGLCAEAVEEEACRPSTHHRRLTTEEAVERHLAFCQGFRAAPAPVATETSDLLIAAVRQLIRRSLDSPRALRSASNSPGRRVSGFYFTSLTS